MSQKDSEKALQSIRSLDDNADGHLTKQELDAAVASGNAEAKQIATKLTTMFKKYDVNGDGMISKSELKNVMLAIKAKAKDKKNSLTEIELEYAFMHADKNSDGKIDVQEFVCWVTGSDDSGKEGLARQKVQAELGHKDKELRGPERFFYDKASYTGVATKGGPNMIDDSHDLRDNVRGKGAAERTQTGQNTQSGIAMSKTEGQEISRPRETEQQRHERLAKEAAPQQSDDEGDWSAVAARFTAFAGKDMDGTEFAKLCKDCSLYDKKFIKQDTDSVFAKVVTRGKRRIDVEQFKNALRLVAAKKQCSVREVQAIVEKSGGPILTATRAEDVRFHDDKNSWTGAQAQGGHTTIDDSHNLMQQCRPALHPQLGV